MAAIIPAKVYIVFIGTGKYVDFFLRWVEAVDIHFLNDCKKTILAFSDQHIPEFDREDVVYTQVPPVVWPEASLYRFKFIREALQRLPAADCLFYLDSDLYPVEEIYLDDVYSASKPLTGVHHPGNWLKPQWETFEKRDESTASVREILETLGDDFIYRQGCFWGGAFQEVQKMCSILDQRITVDENNGVAAIWIDESHMNKYFLENADMVQTVPWVYAFPEGGDWSDRLDGETPMMVHADKSNDEYPRPPSYKEK